MIEKLAYLWPEIVMFIGTCVVMVIGQSPKYELRRTCAWVAGATLVVAGLIAANTPEMTGALLPNLVPYVKVMIAGVGLLLLLLASGTVDRREERLIREGRRQFDPLRTNRGEFYALFLFSLTGAMLVSTADDLIWMFLALELTSLPTYVMVTMSTRRARSQESGIKYFFLGALGAGIFLYGFALLYGGTGTTHLSEMSAIIAQDGLNPIATIGLIMAVVGISFKIAAVPMHFYVADVYEGAAAPVSAFLAFVPKTTGFVAIILLLSVVGWHHGAAPDGTGGRLPESVHLLLWAIAALTMTVGNVLALMQSSLKRLLAYSSVAHSGYMLVGVIVGPGLLGEGFLSNGLAAVLFYLLAYGVMNIGAFAVVACMEREGTRDDPIEVDRVDDLRGLCRSRPVLGWTMVLCGLGLLGFPPLLGFFAKVPLFTAGLSAGEYVLVVVLGVNSAIAAFYYLRLVFLPMLEEPDESTSTIVDTPYSARRIAGVISAGGVVVLAIVGNIFMQASETAAYYPGAEGTIGTTAGDVESDASSERMSEGSDDPAASEPRRAHADE